MGWRRFFKRSRWDAERLREIESYVQIETDDNIARGMRPHAAREAACRKFGNRTQVREEIYRMNTLTFLDTLSRDLRYAWRAIRRNPGFTAIAVLTLALGIGANSALFSLVNAVLIEPLPYPDSDRLVRAWAFTARYPRQAVTLPDYREWRKRNRSFEDMGAYHFLSYNLIGVDDPERLAATRVTASVWTTLGIRPLIGRLFDSSDEVWGQHRVVLLSEGLWRRRFGADPGVIGRSLQLNAESFTVIGVMPAASQFPGPLTQVWTPFVYAPGDNMDSRNNRFSEVIARLKPGVSLAQADRDLDDVAAQVAMEVPQNAGLSVNLVDLKDTYVTGIRPTLLLLFGAAGVVLLIACANVANLLLARASARRRELVVRVALGAGRIRLMRQLLTESLVLAGLGVLLGVGLGYGLMEVLLSLAPQGPRFQEVSLDGTVLGFTVTLGLLTSVMFGLWPAWQGARTDVSEGVKESGRGASAARAGGRVRKVLVVAQVALSLMLLIGASLLIWSLARVQQVNPGFEAGHLLTMQINLPPARYNQGRAAQFAEDAARELAGVPGISAAAATTSLPLGGNEWGKYFTIEGRPAPATLAEVPNVNYRQVTPDYFRTMGARLQRGRYFNQQDRPGNLRTAIVNEALVRRFFPNEDPLGKRIVLLSPEPLMERSPPGGYESWWMTVVGVVADLRSSGLETPPNAEVFATLPESHGEAQNSFFLVARTARDPMDSSRAVEAAIHRLDRNLPLVGLQAMETRLGNSLTRRRFSLFQMVLFAGLALLLALVGLYGVVAYSVAQRSQEMGIRAALGATRRDLVRLVVGQGVVLAACGVVTGLVAAAAFSNVITSQLFEIQPIDPKLYAAAAAGLFLLALLACWLPARRAARTDPALTLRAN